MEGIIRDGVSLSAQQLVDCVSNNYGCNGGTMVNAFEYIIQNQGLASEENYPYTEMQGMCTESNSVAKITGYENVPSNNENALKLAVANQPVSVAIDAYGQSFKLYSGGVFNGDCGTQLTHAVTVVGYGVSSEDGSKYWLIKNSWGDNWGENGYMRLQRDVDAMEGLCGIAMQASYPTVN